MKVSPSCNAISFRFLTLAIKPNESEFQFLKMSEKVSEKVQKIQGFFALDQLENHRRKGKRKGKQKVVKTKKAGGENEFMGKFLVFILTTFVWPQKTA